MLSVAEALNHVQAPADAVRWSDRFGHDMPRAWRECSHADWLLFLALFVRADVRLAPAVVASCVQTAWIDSGEPWEDTDSRELREALGQEHPREHVRAVLEVAFAWAEGRSPPDARAIRLANQMHEMVARFEPNRIVGGESFLEIVDKVHWEPLWGVAHVLQTSMLCVAYDTPRTTYGDGFFEEAWSSAAREVKAIETAWGTERSVDTELARASLVRALRDVISETVFLAAYSALTRSWPG